MSNATTAAADMRSRIGVDDGYGEWSTVTQDQIDQFADLTGDHQWIHSDPERAARETPFGGTIAHGFLTLSLLSHLVRSIAADPPPDDGLLMYINYGFDLVPLHQPGAIRKPGPGIECRHRCRTTRFRGSRDEQGDGRSRGERSTRGGGGVVVAPRLRHVMDNRREQVRGALSVTSDSGH